MWQSNLAESPWLIDDFLSHSLSTWGDCPAGIYCHGIVARPITLALWLPRIQISTHQVPKCWDSPVSIGKNILKKGDGSKPWYLLFTPSHSWVKMDVNNPLKMDDYRYWPIPKLDSQFQLVPQSEVPHIPVPPGTPLAAPGCGTRPPGALPRDRRRRARPGKWSWERQVPGPWPKC